MLKSRKYWTRARCSLAPCPCKPGNPAVNGSLFPEINDVVLTDEVPVRNSARRKLRFLPAFPHHYVISRAGSRQYFVGRQVGKFTSSSCNCFSAAELIGDGAAGVAFESLPVLLFASLLAAGHQGLDFFGSAVDQGLVAVKLGLGFFRWSSIERIRSTSSGSLKFFTASFRLIASGSCRSTCSCNICCQFCAKITAPLPYSGLSATSGVGRLHIRTVQLHKPFGLRQR